MDPGTSVGGSAPGPGAGGVWAPARRELTVGLVLAVTLVAFEALAVATVLPVVSRHLGDLRLYGWVFSAFLLSSLAGIAVAGRLADRTGLTRPMLVGLAVFAVGLVIGGTAVDMPVLVVGRLVQGLGAGVVPATAYVAISRGYPADCRPRMFAVLSTAWVVPGVIGPSIAAVVATTLGWRWVFLGLLPLVAVAGALAARALRTVPRPAGAARPVGFPWAVIGVVGGAATILAGVSSGSPLLAPAGVVVGAGVLAVSLRRLTPPGTLTARPGLPATVLSRGLLTFSFFAGDAYVPYALTTARHAPPVLAGLVLTAATLTWTAGSWVQARAIHRCGPRRLVQYGKLLVLAGLGLMGVALLPAVPAAFAVVAWSVAGAGMGVGYAPLSVTTLDLAVAGEEGRATSGLQLTDVLGQALGTGVAGAAVAAGVAGLGARPGVGLAFAIGAAVGLVGLVVSRGVPASLRSAGPRQVVTEPGRSRPTGPGVTTGEPTPTAASG